MTKAPQSLEIQIWSIDRFVPYARNPGKNDAAIDRMCASIREFGFKVPVLARSDGTVVDGHLRLKAAQVGVVARRRHHRNPRDLVRRMDGCTGQSVQVFGESVRNVGRL